jgi:hypothetical protein
MVAPAAITPLASVEPMGEAVAVGNARMLRVSTW